MHGPRGSDLRVLPSIVGGQDIPGFKHLLTDYAGVGHVQVNFCMSLYLGPVVHGFATALAHVLALAFHGALGYHPIQNRVQV